MVMNIILNGHRYNPKPYVCDWCGEDIEDETYYYNFDDIKLHTHCLESYMEKEYLERTNYYDDVIGELEEWN